MEDKKQLKVFESEKNIRNYVGKCKSLRKKKENNFMEKVKKNQLKTTLQLQTLLQLLPGKDLTAPKYSSYTNV